MAGIQGPAIGNIQTSAVSNQTVDINKIKGTDTSVNNGTADAGTLRVAIASDNTAFTVNAAQSGTWTVQPGNTANTTAWKVDGSAVTQPVSNAGLTELAAAINASSQMDVNIAASNATVTVQSTNLDIRDLTSASDSVAVLQATATNLNAQVVGNIASAASDSGNPIKVGGVYNSTLPNFTTGIGFPLL